MENKNKIMLGLGAIAVALLGKKMYDGRKGSGALRLFPVPNKGRFASEQEAFFAFMQREDRDGKASSYRFKKPKTRKEWMSSLAPTDTYNAEEFEEEGLYAPNGKAEQEYRKWQAQWSGRYTDSQNPWNPQETSGSAWGDGVEEGSDFTQYSETEESWSSAPSSAFSDSFGFPDVNAPRFRK